MNTGRFRNVVPWVLCLPHLSLGFCFCLALRVGFETDYPSLLACVFIGVVFAQAGLVGIWVGMGTNALWVRVAGGAIAVVYLTLLFGLGLDELNWLVLLIIAFITTSTAMLLFGWRVPGYRVSLAEVGDTPDTRLQFKIWHIMLLTLGVGVATALGKLFGVNLFDVALLHLGRLCLPFIMVGSSSVWLILKWDYLIAGSVMLLAIAVVTGGIVGHYWDDEPLLWAVAGTMAGSVLIVTLAILRRFQYRVRKVHPTGAIESPVKANP